MTDQDKFRIAVAREELDKASLPRHQYDAISGGFDAATQEISRLSADPSAAAQEAIALEHRLAREERQQRAAAESEASRLRDLAAVQQIGLTVQKNVAYRNVGGELHLFADAGQCAAFVRERNSIASEYRLIVYHGPSGAEIELFRGDPMPLDRGEVQG